MNFQKKKGRSAAFVRQLNSAKIQDPGRYSATAACACAAYLCAPTFGGQGSQAAQHYTVMLWVLLAMGNAVGAVMTQLSLSFYWKHAENVKKK